MGEEDANHSVETRKTAAELIGWLADAGLRNLPFEQIVDGFSRRLNEMGVSVVRTFVGMNTLHSMLRARSLIWDRMSGPSVKYELDHERFNDPFVQQSPFARILREGIGEERRRLTDRGSLGEETALFEELRSAGMTEWFGVVFPFGDLSPHLRGASETARKDQLWLVCSLTTDQAEGYRNADLATLRQVLPVFAVTIKAATMRSIGQGLLAAYLGNDPANRVLSGTVLRGEVQAIEAVLFYADLRGFTELADTMSGEDLLATLDVYLDCMARPVVARGGEILKFMGDGLLAAFDANYANRAEVCATALDAAEEAVASVDTLNATRQAAGQRFAELDIALHVGEVLYGNVGIDERLDFTVIGPAVNEASRIELMCKSVGQNILASAQFVQARRSRDRLVSVGRHQLRGVRGETELFALVRARP